MFLLVLFICAQGGICAHHSFKLVHIQGIWKPTGGHISGAFIMENFIDNGYSTNSH